MPHTTKAQAALLRLLERHGNMGIIPLTPQDRADAECARKGGLLQRSGLETTLKAEDWLNSVGRDYHQPKFGDKP